MKRLPLLLWTVLLASADVASEPIFGNFVPENHNSNTSYRAWLYQGRINGDEAAKNEMRVKLGLLF